MNIIKLFEAHQLFGKKLQHTPSDFHIVFFVVENLVFSFHTAENKLWLGQVNRLFWQKVSAGSAYPSDDLWK